MSTPVSAYPGWRPRPAADALTALRHSVEQQVTTVVAAECQQQFGHELSAVILTGSMARSEATLRSVPSGNAAFPRIELESDAEFIVILSDGARLPRREMEGALAADCERELRVLGIGIHIDLSCCHRTYLRSLPPHIFTYELRARGRVVWGKPETLEQIPDWRPAQLELEDAWRLLCNRTVEQLQIVEDLPLQSRRDPHERLRYRLIKLYLDMATSLLVFAGMYAPGYRQRCENLGRLRANADAQEWPFPLAWFYERVRACTEAKLSGAGPLAAGADPGLVLAWWRDALENLQRLQGWELQAMLGGPAGDYAPTASCERFAAWRRAQPWQQRLRGWLALVRRTGWRGMRLWPRWARLTMEGSPRYLIYQAAALLTLRLPEYLEREDGEQSPVGQSASNFTALAEESAAPKRRESGEAAAAELVGGLSPLPLSPGASWRDCAALLLHQYRGFLQDTRA